MRARQRTRVLTAWAEPTPPASYPWQSGHRRTRERGHRVHPAGVQHQRGGAPGGGDREAHRKPLRDRGRRGGEGRGRQRLSDPLPIGTVPCFPQLPLTHLETGHRSIDSLTELGLRRPLRLELLLKGPGFSGELGTLGERGGRVQGRPPASVATLSPPPARPGWSFQVA